MRYLLVSDLIRNPQGRVAEHKGRLGNVCWKDRILASQQT